jgi:hypothetical protein
MPRSILTHAWFRERSTDKVRAYSDPVPDSLEPHRPKKHLESRSPVASHPGEVGPFIAKLLHGLRTSLIRALRTAFPAAFWRPAHGVSFHALEEGGILVSEAKQSIYALSPSAAFLWCCLEEGYSHRSTAVRYAEASGRSKRAARAELASAVEAWRDIELLDRPLEPFAPTQPPEAGEPGRERSGIDLRDLPVRRRYRVLDTTFEVGFANEALCDLVDPVLRHLETSRSSDASVAVTEDRDGFGITIDGISIDRCGTLEALAPLVKGNLNAAAINRHEFALYLHAAMLRRGNWAIVLPAPPGSGKSCLAAALARQSGFAYHTDEITLLQSGPIRARGSPVALSIKEGGWTVLKPHYPKLARLATHHRADGAIVRYLPPPVEAGDPALDQFHQVRWIVMPTYVAAGPNRIEPLARVSALQLLLDECLALRLYLDAGSVQELVDWISEVECHRLTFNDLEAATRLIDQVCSGPASARSLGAA